MAKDPGGGDDGGSGGHDVPAVPAIPLAGPGPNGAAAPTAWEPGASRSPYAAPPRPVTPAATAGGTTGVTGAPGRPWDPPPGGFGGPAAPGQGAPAPAASTGPDVPFALPQMARAPLDGVAVASVVAGALGTGPIALALGIVGLRRTTRAWRRSPRIATAGIALGAVGTIGWVVVGVVAALGGFTTSGGTSEAGDVAEPRTVHPSLVAPGNCVELLPAQQEVGEVTLVPCAQDHVAQALTTWELDDASYPGPEGALKTAEDICTAELAERGLDGAEYLPWWFVPTPAAWDEGERTATCLVRSSGSLLTVDLVG
ncbi:hypothetical protein C8046_14500 [Serinibacter arcticus]|uniref:Septum formation-related domain-containing protein n=1 Tax=Serinibacter arcticus TaxID=1655435 RepID=A0A2U1ZXF9_9MICO|nr:septum formation family protein [Serinibacter arcticus]PWD51675.1 hypothetical protein C8046_14500 [Serinibacter arcticus]